MDAAAAKKCQVQHCAKPYAAAQAATKTMMKAIAALVDKFKKKAVTAAEFKKELMAIQRSAFDGAEARALATCAVGACLPQIKAMLKATGAALGGTHAAQINARLGKSTFTVADYLEILKLLAAAVRPP